jgi:hypothetical protein
MYEETYFRLHNFIYISVVVDSYIKQTKLPFLVEFVFVVSVNICAITVISVNTFRRFDLFICLRTHFGCSIYLHFVLVKCPASPGP